MVGEGPVPLEQLAALVEKGSLKKEDAGRLRERHGELTDRLHDVFESVAELRRQMQKRAETVRADSLKPLVDMAVDRVLKEVADPRVEGYLSALREDLMANIEVFAADDDDDDRYVRWRVNLAVDHGQTEAAPVVIETEPTYTRLFGTIERLVTPSGETVSNFTADSCRLAAARERGLPGAQRRGRAAGAESVAGAQAGAQVRPGPDPVDGVDDPGRRRPQAGADSTSTSRWS